MPERRLRSGMFLPITETPPVAPSTPVRAGSVKQK